MAKQGGFSQVNRNRQGLSDDHRSVCAIRTTMRDRGYRGSTGWHKPTEDGSCLPREENQGTNATSQEP